MKPHRFSRWGFSITLHFMTSDVFTGIVGHEAAKRVLTQALVRPHHAYLIQGASGLGAHTLAERFVRALLGAAAERSFLAHPDLVLIGREVGEDGALMGLTVGVDAVRAARVRLSERAVIASRLVAYVPEADRLGVEAANMLLKSMEEPSAAAVFVLVAHDGERIPATVKSRLVGLRLGPVAAQEIDTWLSAQGVAEPERREAVRLAGGRPGFALRWARDPEERKRLAEAARVIDAALRATSAGQAMAAFDALFRAADAAEDAVAAWRGLCDALSYALRDRFAETPARAAKIAHAVIAAERHLGGAVSPRVWFEVALLGQRAPARVV